MILKGSQRSGGAQLAAHLLNARDNDHVRVGELRGFASEHLHGAFKEAQAVASGTRCKQYLFSLSLNPPKGASVSEREFEQAADAAERALGLDGQPRAIVYHEKEGRRHAHVVWSRIDARAMRAINLSHFKNRLTALSRELYLEHGWQLPEGLRPDGIRNPLSFALDEWQRAKREGLDPREVKQVFRDAWNRSDSRKAFANALAEYGFFLARGDRRGFVAVDVEGSVYAIAKWASVKAKDVALKLGDAAALPPVDLVARELRQRTGEKMREFIAEMKSRHAGERVSFDQRLQELRSAHRAQRERLDLHQRERWNRETDARAAKLRTGLAGLLDRLTGRAKAIRNENEQEAFAGLRRDQRQRDALIIDQMRERRAFQNEIDALRQKQSNDRQALARSIMDVLRRDAVSRDAAPPAPAHNRRKRGFSLDR